MEKIIVLPMNDEKSIFPSQVENLIDSEGIILVYNKDEKVVGSVVKDKKNFVMRTILEEQYSPTLDLFIVDYPEYKFKFIT
jgi:hypothetical protein